MREPVDRSGPRTSVLSELARAIEHALPLRIIGVEFQDPIAGLIGVDWSLSLACPWWVNRDSDVLAAWDRDSAEDGLQDLVGRSLLGLREAGNGFDPIFQCSAQIDVEVSADTDVDPWVMRLPGRTFVGEGPSSGANR